MAQATKYATKKRLSENTIDAFKKAVTQSVIEEIPRKTSLPLGRT